MDSGIISAWADVASAILAFFALLAACYACYVSRKDLKYRLDPKPKLHFCVAYDCEDGKEVGVCGIDSDEWVQVPAAFIVAKDAAQCTQLEAYCQERLAHYKVPKSFHIVEELPRNGSNKLMRRHLKDLL